MATAWEAPSVRLSKQFSSSAPAFASLFLQVLQQQFPKDFQSSYHQTYLQGGRLLPSQGDGKELQPQSQTSMVTKRPHDWLSPVLQHPQLAFVPGVGRMRKSDLVLLRAVHKGELDVDDENAPDMTALSHEQLTALEAFFDTVEEKQSSFCKSLVHETPLTEAPDPQKSGLPPDMGAPPGLENVIPVVPRTAKPIDSIC